MAYPVHGPTKPGWAIWLLHKLVVVCTATFLALAKAHVEVLAPACNVFVSVGLLGLLGDIPAAVWECAWIPAITCKLLLAGLAM